MNKAMLIEITFTAGILGLWRLRGEGPGKGFLSKRD
jgi:hypothetical protein